MRKLLILSALYLASSLAALPGAWAQTLIFNKVASTNTAVPGHDGNFVNFDGGPAVSNGVVVFTGIYVVDNKARQGVFTGKADGSAPVLVADAGESVPGRAGAVFGLVENPVIDAGAIAFFGSYPDTTQPPIQPGQYPDTVGVFTAATGSAQLAILRGSGSAPDGGDFDSPVAISRGTVALGNRGGVASGVVGTEGTTPIVDTRSVAPGLKETFTGLTNASVSGLAVAFGGDTLDHSGLFLATAGVTGSAIKLLDDATLAPEGTAFEEFEGTAISGTTVAFVANFKGTSQTNEGVYTTATTAPAPVLVADTDTLVPGRTGYEAGAEFDSFVKVPIIVGDTVVFQGFYRGNGEGIFMWNKGVLTPVVTTEDSLFGGTPADLFLGAGGYDGRDITFHYALSNGERGIAVVTVGSSGSGGGAATVGVAAVTGNVAADGSRGPGMFTVTRTGDLSAKVVVKYVVKGSAQVGVDYERLPGRLKLKPGKASATVNVVPLGVGDRGKRVVRLVIQPGSGYSTGDTAAAKIKLVPVE